MPPHQRVRAYPAIGLDWATEYSWNVPHGFGSHFGRYPALCATLQRKYLAAVEQPRPGQVAQLNEYQRDIEAAVACVIGNYAGYTDKCDSIGGTVIDNAIKNMNPPEDSPDETIKIILDYSHANEIQEIRGI